MPTTMAPCMYSGLLCSEMLSTVTSPCGSRVIASSEPLRGAGKAAGTASFATAFLDARPASPVDFSSSHSLAYFIKTEASRTAALLVAQQHRNRVRRPVAGEMPPLLEDQAESSATDGGMSLFGGTMSREAARQAGAGHQLANYTVHVAENGSVENEVTLEMARLLRKVLQANLGLLDAR